MKISWVLPATVAVLLLGLYGYNINQNLNALKPVREYCKLAPRLMKHKLNPRALNTFLGPYQKTLFQDVREIQKDACNQWKEALQWWKLNLGRTFVLRQKRERQKRIIKSAKFVNKRCVVAYPNMIIGMLQGYRGLQNKLSEIERKNLRKKALNVCRVIKEGILSFSKAPKRAKVWDLGKGLPEMLSAMKKHQQP